MDHSQLLAFLGRLGACAEALSWLQQDCARCDLAAAWERCESPAWLFKMFYRIGIPRERIILAACAVARLPLDRFWGETERRKWGDAPLECLLVTERWCQGEASLEEVGAARRRASACGDAFALYIAAACADAAELADPYTAAEAAAYAAHRSADVSAGYIEAVAAEVAYAAGEAAYTAAGEAGAKAEEARRAMARDCCAAIRASIPLAEIEERVVKLWAVTEKEGQ
jgi:hypothetical protein